MDAVINIPQKSYSIKDGLNEAMKYVKGSDITRVSGVSSAVISFSLAGTKDGYFYAMRDDYVDKVNKALLEIGTTVMNYTVSYDNAHADVRGLMKLISLPNLFENELGISHRMMKDRVGSKHSKVYGKFKPQLVDQINEALRRIALNILQIHLEYKDRPSNRGL